MKCRDGVEIKERGACPACGALPEDECRGRGFLEMMARRAKEDEDREAEKMKEAFHRALSESRHDRRL